MSNYTIDMVPGRSHVEWQDLQTVLKSEALRTAKHALRMNRLIAKKGMGMLHYLKRIIAQKILTVGGENHGISYSRAVGNSAIIL